MTTHRLARLSQGMAVVTLWFIVAMLLLNAAVWWFPEISPAANGYGIGFALTNGLIARLGLDVSGMPWWQTLGCILLSSVPLLALAHGLRHLRSLFNLYACGAYFSAAAATHL